LRPIDINESGRLSPRLKTNGGDITITNQTTGLVAYVLTQVDNNTEALTLAQAIDVANFIIAKAYAA
jgi:hypothetical protein